MIYEKTRNFPREEMFGLTMQMRRASVSITSNIAEGFSRHSFKEKLQFFSIAHGSLTELQDQILVGRDVGYLEKSAFEEISEHTITVHRLLNAFIRRTKEF